MTTLILDKNRQMIKMIPWQDAALKVVRGKATVLKFQGDKPRIIQLKSFCLRDILHKAKVQRLSVRSLLQRDDYCCQYCGIPLTEQTVTQDHVFPWARGGKTVSTNLVCACKSCNEKKKDLTPQQAGMKLMKPVRQVKMFDPTKQMIRLYQDFRSRAAIEGTATASA